jgi:signal transduction histidine kinase
VALLVLAVQAQEPAPGLLTSCAAVRALPRDVAAKKLPVRITGVVCFRPPIGSYQGAPFILHDGGSGIYCQLSPDLNGLSASWEVGDKMEITGITSPGDYAPIIFLTEFKRLGTGQLPGYRPSRHSELLSGRYISQMVSVEGVVRRTRVDLHGFTHMEMVEEGGTFTAIVFSRERMPAFLVDARLRLEGVCSHFFTPRGETAGIQIRMSDPRQVTVLKPGGEDPFSAPLAAPLALNPFRPGEPFLHRQRLIGIVTLHRPGEFLVLKCEQRSFRVYSRQEGQLAVGDLVEASGFVEQTRNGSFLTEAVFRINGRGSVPAPRRVTRKDLLAVLPWDPGTLRKDDFDGVLITIKATLLKADQDQRDGRRLHVLHEGVVCVASLGALAPAQQVARLQPGSLLELTGVCEQPVTTQWGEFGPPKVAGFSLQLRGIEDVRVLSSPSWWTVPRLTVAMGISVAAALLIFLWNLFLQRTVKRQTAVAANRIAMESRLEERQRIGRELHDTLHQELTGIGMLIGNTKALLNEPERALGNLEMAERMVKRANKESRGSVQKLMSVTLDEQGLATALAESVGPLAEMGGASFHLDLPADLPRFGPRVETSLLRIAHEAAANAGRHAQAREVYLTLRSTAQEVVMEVRDNGRGFDPTIIDSAAERHFGLLSMEQRALKLKGRFEIESSPENGTTIRLTLPLLTDEA